MMKSLFKISIFVALSLGMGAVIAGTDSVRGIGAPMSTHGATSPSAQGEKDETSGYLLGFVEYYHGPAWADADVSPGYYRSWNSESSSASFFPSEWKAARRNYQIRNRIRAPYTGQYRLYTKNYAVPFQLAVPGSGWQTIRHSSSANVDDIEDAGWLLRRTFSANEGEYIITETKLAGSTGNLTPAECDLHRSTFIAIVGDIDKPSGGAKVTFDEVKNRMYGMTVNPARLTHAPISNGVWRYDEGDARQTDQPLSMSLSECRSMYDALQ